MEKIPFCILPWIHSYVDGEGNRALCCIAKPYDRSSLVNDMGLAEYGKWLGSIRKEMIDGKVPKECINCSKGMAFENQRNALNENLNEEFQIVCENSNDELEDIYSPVYLDYRVDNTCNLSCLSCSGHLSSTIAKKVEAAGIKEHRRIDQKKQYREEFFEILDNSSFGVVYFASGEPFMSNFHWEVVSKLRGKEREFKLFYNSNLTINRHKGRPIVDYLKSFKQIDISLSLDSDGKTGELLRQGLSFEKWKNNYAEFAEAELLKHSKVFCVLSIPALLNCLSFIKFCQSIDREIIFTPVLGNAHELLLMPEILDQATFDLIIESIPSEVELPKFLFKRKELDDISPVKIRNAVSYFYRLGLNEGGSELLKFYCENNLLKSWFRKLLKHGFVDSSQVLRFDDVVIDFVVELLIEDIKIIRCGKFSTIDFNTINKYWSRNGVLKITFEQPSCSFIRKLLIKNSPNSKQLQEEIHFFEASKEIISKSHDLIATEENPRLSDFFNKSGRIQKTIFFFVKLAWLFRPKMISMREILIIKLK